MGVYVYMHVCVHCLHVCVKMSTLKTNRSPEKAQWLRALHSLHLQSFCLVPSTLVSASSDLCVTSAICSLPFHVSVAVSHWTAFGELEFKLMRAQFLPVHLWWLDRRFKAVPLAPYLVVPTVEVEWVLSLSLQYSKSILYCVRLESEPFVVITL
jgi:hypothetical protein